MKDRNGLFSRIEPKCVQISGLLRGPPALANRVAVPGVRIGLPSSMMALANRVAVPGVRIGLPSSMMALANRVAVPGVCFHTRISGTHEPVSYTHMTLPTIALV